MFFLKKGLKKAKHNTNAKTKNRKTNNKTGEDCCQYGIPNPL